MKVVQKEHESLADLLAKGKEAESAGLWAGAEKIYQRMLKRDNHSLPAFQRLMIVYRKQSDFIKELAIVDKAIEAFSRLYTPKTAHSKRVKTLSAQINKAFGMIDRKGNSLYDPGPVAVWKRRKAWVEKKMRR